MSAEVRQGAIAPEVYQLDLTPGSSGVDLSTVTAASLKVRRPDGTTTTWTAARSAQTAATLTLTHGYVAGDTDVLGPHSIYAVLTIPSGTARSLPKILLVKDPYAVP